MSRIGNSPIEIPQGVQVALNETMVTVKGPKGELSTTIPKRIVVKKQDNILVVERKNEEKTTRALHGLTRSLIYNNCIGVVKGFEKELELVGVGYRASLKGSNLELTVGFSHPVEISSPKGIEFQVKKNIIVVSGIDKQLVGLTAAKIRDVKKPEPYKGKGIRYVGEYVRKKAGKSAKAIGGSPGA